MSTESRLGEPLAAPASNAPVSSASAGMRVVRLFAGFVMTVISILALAAGGLTAFGTDWVPRRSISSFELGRAELARDYVEAEATRLGRLPTYVEFKKWIAHAPPELEVEGQGFSYWPERGKYAFSWWDGDAVVTWYPTRDLGSVLISPKNVFIFGSKLMDLLVFFGLAAAMLNAVYWLLISDGKDGPHAH